MRRYVDKMVDARDHLALDEALLLAAEADEIGESLRIWELPKHAAIAGRSTRVADEIDVSVCREREMPVLRRCSGGAAVIGGPGCLMYSVVLGLGGHRDLRKIDVAHRYVMSRVLSALREQLPDAELSGTCDLTWQNRKCSGNSLRVTRGHLLYHGTLLYDFDLRLIDACLRVAPRQPEYRQGRDHHEFVTNVSIDASQFSNDLCRVFEAFEESETLHLSARVAELRRTRYDNPQWHLRH